ncbi:MAG: hypothetical protein ACO1OQ_08460 [Rufibacter sp.]
MNLPLPLVLSLALLLGAWLTWLAVRRADRRRLAERLVASWVAVACLALLASPSKITRTYSASEAILLTDGYSPDTLQALLNRLQSKPQVFAFETEAKQAKPITDFTAFQAKHPAVQTLHVLGHGLVEEELASVSTLRLVPHLSPLPAGMLSASWPKKITLGEPVQVQGTFTSPEKSARLFLHAAGANRDSVEVKKGVGQAFQLAFTPKTSGRFVYQLQWHEEDSLHQETIPIMVEEPRLLNVLLLSSAPSFEVKFLKNALAEQGHRVAVRQEVSQNIYQTETINLSKQSLNRLTPALLQQFDVVLLDEVTLQGLSGQEKQALQQAVRQQGLGILTSFSQNSAKLVPFFAEASFRQISQKQARNAPVQWQGNTTNQALLAASNKILQPREWQQPLAWARTREQPMTLRYRKGLGQVGVSLISETFPLALEGKEQLYQQYWATVLTALAKPEQEMQQITLQQDPLSVQPFQAVMLFSSSALAEEKVLANTSDTTNTAITSYPSLLFPNHYQLSFWPQHLGWHSFPRREFNLYVHMTTAWRTLKLSRRQQTFVNALHANAAYSSPLQGNKEEPILLWHLGLPFLIALAFLWLEEKFF